MAAPVASTVTVACKLPHGLKLRIFRMEKTHEPIMGGGTREVPIARPIPGKEFTINGTSHRQNVMPDCLVRDSFAFTENVPKDLWDEWLEQNKMSDMVKNGLIFASSQSQSVTEQAKDHREIRSGFERLDPNKKPNGIVAIKN
jgi:hypothetical protein